MLRTRKKKGQSAKLSVTIRADALNSIFDECDRYDHDETGGRILGGYNKTSDGSLQIDVTGVIEPGPNARRSPGSFFQDGDYQAEVFRKLEESHPEIEHLGNWHTHHVNGYPTLSGGDISTYQRIVNHEKHNIDFFYALLVVARIPNQSQLKRYKVRHYVLFANDKNVYEINPNDVTVTDQPSVWPVTEKMTTMGSENDKPPVPGRSSDQQILKEMFPKMNPFMAKDNGVFYWKGSIDLVDESKISMMVPEVAGDNSNDPDHYVLLLKNLPDECVEAGAKLADEIFVSAAQAVQSAEKRLNKALFNASKSKG